MKLTAAIVVALVITSGAASAQTVLVLGGAAAGRFVHTGDRDSSLLHEGAPSDGRFEVGGILGLSSRTRRTELRLALLVGGVIAVVADEFRKPMMRFEVEHQWHPTTHLSINSSMLAEMEPTSLGTVSALRGGSAKNSTVFTAGVPTLTLQPVIAAELELNRQHQLIGRIGLDAFAMLTGLMTGTYDNEYDDVKVAQGIQLELGYQRRLDRSHAWRGLALGRAMRAATPGGTPTTLLVGAQVGYTYRLRSQLQLDARAGVGKVLRLPEQYLWPVEPLLGLDLTWFNRLDRISAGFSLGVREYVYLAGLPMRQLMAAVRYQRVPSWRPLRWVAELTYEYAHFGHGQGTISTNNQHTIGLRGRLYYTLFGGWRVVGEAATRVGFIDEGTPNSGYWFTGLVGVAYLHMARPRDEAVIGEVW